MDDKQVKNLVDGMIAICQGLNFNKLIIAMNGESDATCKDCINLNKNLMWCEITKRHVTLDWMTCKKFKRE